MQHSKGSPSSNPICIQPPTLQANVYVPAKNIEYNKSTHYVFLPCLPHSLPTSRRSYVAKKKKTRTNSTHKCIHQYPEAKLATISLPNWYHTASLLRTSMHTSVAFLRFFFLESYPMNRIPWIVSPKTGSQPDHRTDTKLDKKLSK